MADSGTSGLATLSEAGVSVWLDDLSRERLNSGNLAELIAKYHVVGVTTNPTIFAAALAHGNSYDDQVRELAARDASVDTAAREITTTDVRTAADAFREVHQRTHGVDGRVSIEVDPRLARDTETTVDQALDLWKTVDRPNVFIKIPATIEGLDAISRTLAEGISVNVTLIFSVERYRKVIGAFLTGLERAKQNGHELSGIESVASFFVSRVDTEVDTRIDAIGSSEANALRGQAAVANARLAYAAFQEEFAGERWATLAAAGARRQRPLWASTGVKDPSYPDTKYVDELVVAGVVNTMPEKTLHAVDDHGDIRGDTVTGRAEEAARVFDGLRAVGIDVTDVYRSLEEQGVEKFDKSWADLLDTLADQLRHAKG